MITLRPVLNFSGITALSKLTPSSERKISFKAEPDCDLFDSELSGIKDKTYSENLEKFNSTLNRLNKDYESGGKSADFVNKKLKTIVEQDIAKLHPREWKGAIDSVFNNIKPDAPSANRTRRSIAGFIETSKNVIRNNAAAKEFFTPEDMFNLFNRVLNSFESEDNFRSKYDNCGAMASQTWALGPEYGKKAINSLLEVMEPMDDKGYYHALKEIIGSSVHNLNSDDMPEMIDTLIEAVNQEHKCSQVDEANAELDRLLDSLEDEDYCEAAKLKPAREKLRSKMEQREKNLYRNR